MGSAPGFGEEHLAHLFHFVCFGRCIDEPHAVSCHYEGCMDEISRWGWWKTRGREQGRKVGEKRNRVEVGAEVEG